ncbi:hypothetical protein ACFLYO_01465 [Chloroflexota bacterium]
MNKLKRGAGLILLLIGIGELLLLLGGLFIADGPTLHGQQGAATVQFEADRRAVLLPGQCVPVRWQVDGVEAVYLGRDGQGGVGEQSFCLDGTERPTLAVVFVDGSRIAYPLDVVIAVYSLEVWLALTGGLSLVLAGIWLAKIAHYRLIMQGILLVAGLALLAVVALWLIHPGPLVIHETVDDVYIYSSTDRRWLLDGEDCFLLEWDIDPAATVYIRSGVREIHTVASSGEDEYCGYERPYLEVVLPDGRAIHYPAIVPIFVLPQFWAALLLGLALVGVRQWLWSGNASGVRQEARFVLRVAAKTLALLVVFNLLFALLFTDDMAGLSLYNWLVPGRPRFPTNMAEAEAYTVNTNSLPAFFAAHELRQSKPEDEFRVLLLGDSGIWGWHLHPEDTLAAQLTALGLTTDDGRQVQVYNLAGPIPAVDRDILVMDYAQRYDPDLIIWPITKYTLRETETHPLLRENAAEMQALLAGLGSDMTAYDLQLHSSDNPTVLDQTIFANQDLLNEIFRLQLTGVMWGVTGIEAEYGSSYRLIDRSPQRSAAFAAPLDENRLDLLTAWMNEPDQPPILLFNEPIFVQENEDDSGPYNILYDQEPYDAYRALLADRAATNEWSYVDLWDAVTMDEYTDGPLHYSPAGVGQLSAALAPLVLDLANNSIE